MNHGDLMCCGVCLGRGVCGEGVLKMAEKVVETRRRHGLISSAQSTPADLT